MAYYRRN